MLALLTTKGTPMKLFKKKHNPFIANVTRTALGEGYMVRSAIESRRESPNDLGNPLTAICDRDLEELPEAAAAMMIYGYCTIKYQAPTTPNVSALRQLLASRGHSEKDIDALMLNNKGSLFDLITFNLQYEQAAYTFTNQELLTFYNNLCKRSTIFKQVSVS